MKTNENQKSTNSQPATQKPFFGAKPEQAFFTAERTPSTPFFQKSSTIQAKSTTDENEELNQLAVQRMSAFESEEKDKGEVQRQEESNIRNQTGLPDNLKAGVENFSGYSLDDVRVHYNSPKPAQLQALAYTQGMDIYVAPGQEKHLPHESWHVVQQMQGRVKPTKQKKGVQINDDQGLEREATMMGENALRNEANWSKKDQQTAQGKERKYLHAAQMQAVVQRVLKPSTLKGQSLLTRKYFPYQQGQSLLTRKYFPYQQGQSLLTRNFFTYKQELSSVIPKKVTYKPGQMTNTTLYKIITKEIKVVTHGTNEPREVLRGEKEQSLKTNPGTTGDFVYFLPSWKNSYGQIVYAFDKDRFSNLLSFINGEYRLLGEVSTAQSLGYCLGYYTRAQLTDVESRILRGKDMETLDE